MSNNPWQAIATSTSTPPASPPVSTAPAAPETPVLAQVVAVDTAQTEPSAPPTIPAPELKIAPLKKPSNLFELRGSLKPRTSSLLRLLGPVFLVAMWQAICSSKLVGPKILPPPLEVLRSLPELHFQDALVKNLLYSLALNCAGYIEAVLVCIPLGMVIGMFPLFNEMFAKPVNSIRAIPLTACTGLFMVWFGIDNFMKIQFLAAGIIVYLLPVVVQRTREAPVVYQQTAFTLGASKLQTIRTVFWPYLRSTIILDIQVLVAISWTYIIIAEMENNTGGIGAMLYGSARAGRIDKTFMMLFIIVGVVFAQDKLFVTADKLINKHKYS